MQRKWSQRPCWTQLMLMPSKRWTWHMRMSRKWMDWTCRRMGQSYGKQPSRGEDLNFVTLTCFQNIVGSWPCNHFVLSPIPYCSMRVKWCNTVNECGLIDIFSVFFVCVFLCLFVSAWCPIIVEKILHFLFISFVILKNQTCPPIILNCPDSVPHPPPSSCK